MASDWAAALRRALDAAGFDDHEITDRLTVRLGEQSSWLAATLDGSSLEPPTLAQYLMISAVTNVMVPVLTGEVTPAESVQIALRSGALSAQVADIEPAQERAVSLLRAARLVGAWNGVPLAERRSSLDRLRAVVSHAAYPPKAGEETARQVRNRLEKTTWLSRTAPVVDLVGLVEASGIPVEFTDRLPDGVHGLTVHDGTLGEWDGVILIRAQDYWVRQRYTLAHEFCHALFRDTGTGFINDDATMSSDVAEERRAESFARHFLVPERPVRMRWAELVGAGRAPSDALCDVILHFGISRQAAIHTLQSLRVARAAELSALTAHEVTVNALMTEAGLSQEWRDACVDQHEPGASPWLSKVALDLFAEGKVSVKTVANVLGRDVNTVVHELAAQGWAQPD